MMLHGKNVLAVSSTVETITVNPVNISKEDKEKVARALSDIFETDYEKTLKKVSKKSAIETIAKKVDKEKTDKLRLWMDQNNITKGINIDEDTKRYYPYNSLASQIIGFCGSDNQGLDGVEAIYDEELKGTTGKIVKMTDAKGGDILKEGEDYISAVDGNDLILTIDATIQGIAEKYLKEACIDNKCTDGGNIVIMNPKNGDILAMAGYPDYNLNAPYEPNTDELKNSWDNLSQGEKTKNLQAMWRNKAISDTYEPGSTFKPITVAASFDEGASYDGKHYFCDGGQQIGTTYIKCVAHTIGGHKDTDPCKALMKSCNDVMMQMAADLGVNKFTKYVRSFGFGAKTGIDLPGEAVGGIFSKEDLHQVELATSSFGQGQTVTMIQLISAFCATINGGNYYQPHVVKEIDSQNGAVVSSYDKVLVKRVISDDTSKFIRKYLEKTVEDDEGTASPARVKGYVIGGKTGTAEKHPITKKKYLVSFAGFTPVDKPELAIYVVIDEPHVKDQAHSTYATEFASEVLKDVLPMLGIYKESGKSSDAKAVTIPSTKKGNSILEVPAGGYTTSDYGVAKSKKNANN